MNRMVFLVLAILLAGTVHAGNARWTTSGPYGDPGPILFHPADPNIIFSGFFRSTDAGLTWSPFKPPPSAEILRIAGKAPYPLITAEVNGLLILHQSSDLGRTWTRLSTTRLHLYGSSAGLSDFQISASNPDVMYTSSIGAGVLRSVNGGKNWTVLSRDLPGPEHSFGTLQISPTASDVVYYIYSDSRAGTTALLKTVNGGRNWTSTGPKLEYLQGMALRIDPRNQQVVYTGTRFSQYKSTDSGKTWKRLTLPAGSGVGNFWVNPRNTAEVWTTGTQTFRSTNGGASWAHVTLQRFNHPYMIAFGSAQPLRFAVGLDLLRSTDDGKTWKASNTGLRGLQALMLDASTARPGRILAPAGLSGIYRSTDSGSTWTPFVRFNNQQITTVRSHPANGSILGVITGGDQFSISTNGGVSWKTLKNRTIDFAFHPQKEKTIYFSDGKSTDGGTTFHEYALHPDGIGILQVVADPSNGETLYLRTDRSLYKSMNGGDTWSKVPLHTPNVLQSMRIAPSHPNILYVGSSDGIYTSTNAGASWVHYGKNSGVLDPIAADPADPLSMFAIYFGFRLQRSTDGGKSFTNFDTSGLPAGIDLYSGVLDTLNPRTLHLATSSGIYSYTRP